MRRLLTVAVVVLVGGLVAPAVPAGADVEYRRIHFPTEGAVSFTDDFGAARSGGRTHEGNDLMGTKLQHVLAAVDGRVSFIRLDSSGLSGNMVTIVDGEGWRYSYMHLNNDTPGTDDGAAGADQTLAPGIAVGARVHAGDFVALLGDSGNAEATAPHLHFEIRRPDGTPIDPWASLRLAEGLPAGTRCGYDVNPRPTPDPTAGPGYWAAGADGGVFGFGAAPYLGSTGGLRLNQPVVALAAAPSGRGYWLVARDGGVFAFGDAPYVGSTGGLRLNRPIVGATGTPTGHGYWLVASDGGVFAFGDAPFLGSTGGTRLNQPVVAMAATRTGRGYWLLAADGGVFAFGDALFAGSLPGAGVRAAAVSMAPSRSGNGYWLLGRDGGVFGFGDAPFAGSIPGFGLCRGPDGVRMAATSTGRGYWVLAADASVWAFGDAVYRGGPNAIGVPLAARVVDFVPMPVPRAIAGG